MHVYTFEQTCFQLRFLNDARAQNMDVQLSIKVSILSNLANTNIYPNFWNAERFRKTTTNHMLKAVYNNFEIIASNYDWSQLSFLSEAFYIKNSKPTINERL